MKKIIEFLRTNLTKKITTTVGYRISEIFLWLCTIVCVLHLFITFGKLYFENEKIKEDKATLEVENEIIYKMLIQERYGIVDMESTVQGDISIVCE